MTESLRIETGAKKILINDGPEFIEFNPFDVAFVEKFYSVFTEFKMKTEEFKAQATELDSHSEIDEDGLPVNMLDRMKFARELCDYSYGQIDVLFGEGTSEKVFRGVRNVELVEQFFGGLIPFIQNEREEKLKKYKVNDSKVMK